jgi:eukaryotic-like serine/threonine-protein kinase
MSSLDSPDRYPQAGDVLDGKYRIEALLAEGGMGAVAKATHLVRRAFVALKFMGAAARSHPGAEERFINECVAASRIDSDHVVKVFDVGHLPNGAPYLVMEFLDGCDLAQLLERDGPRLEPARAVHFTLQMLRALQKAHTVGIIHRDMKPSNCFVIEKDGERDFIKLVDFGISKLESRDTEPALSLTGTSTIFGTPLYMSPEQAKSARDVDHRSDLYSSGAILYEMLSGRTPYTAEGGENILYKVFMTEPDSIKSICPEISDGLAATVHRALLRDLDARFGSAVEMAQALAPFADARSAQVLGSLLGNRGRSFARAAGMASVQPEDPLARARPEDASAATSPSGGTDALAPVAAPTTDMGVSRETSVKPSRPRHAVVLLAAATTLAVLTSGVGLVAVKRCATAPSESTPSVAVHPTRSLLAAPTSGAMASETPSRQPAGSSTLLEPVVKPLLASTADAGTSSKDIPSTTRTNAPQQASPRGRVDQRGLAGENPY